MKFKTNNKNKSKRIRSGKKDFKEKRDKKVNIPRELTFYESRIMNVLRRDRKRVFSSRELYRISGFEDKASFYDALHSLENEGYIINDNHDIVLNELKRECEGEIISLSKGFGFVRPIDDGEDIFIPGRDLMGAYIGDKVLVSDIEKSKDGLNGKIVRVIEKSRSVTTGTVSFENYYPELIPDNNLRYNPIITHLNGAKEGDKVLCKLYKDYRDEWSECKVIKIFGEAECARVCADAIIEQYGIPSVFPEDVLKDAEDISAKGITSEDLNKRIDLRDKNIFTIDGADAKDLDDAISVEKTETGYVLGVHIADVSHYVKGRSLVDEEAMIRGTSVYFADRVIPMLPECISNGICSLNAGTDKLAFSCIMNFDFAGKMLSYEFKKSVINSKVRGVYSEVNEIFNGSATEETLKKYEPVKAELENARELALILKKNMGSRGTMEIESDESRFVLDENGVCIDILPREIGEAQGLIEQFMISANIAAAKFSQELNIPFLYRIHEQPEPQRVRELVTLLKALGIPCRELLKEKPTTADFAVILERAKDTEAESLVSKQVLRTMEKARYSVEPKGHFGLALKDYSHFTSPIRRYPDTSIHRILSAYLEGETVENIVKRYTAFAEASAADSSAAEIRAMRAERDCEDCYMAEYLKNHLGEEFEGEVSSVTRNGVFVRLSNTAEGFLPVVLYKNNNFVFDGAVTQRCTKTGKILTIGTKLKIKVASASIATGKVDFAPAQE